MPEAARANTEAGAEAFVRFFLGLVNDAWGRPQVGVLTPFSDSACQFCQKTEADAAAFVKAGHRVAAPSISVGPVVKPVDAPAGQAFFEIELQQSSQDIVDAKGSVVEQTPAGRQRVKVGAAWTPDGWRFLDLESLS